MPNLNHTRGPWTAHPFNPLAVCGGFSGRVIGSFEREPDAKLARAAPALLAALESMLQGYAPLAARTDPALFAPCVRDAVAAVKLARGE